MQDRSSPVILLEFIFGEILLLAQNIIISLNWMSFYLVSLPIDPSKKLQT